MVGNFLGLKAIHAAPNPGYAEVLKTSQILIVTLASVFLFHSHFSWQKLIGIGFVIIGVALIAI